MRGGFSDLGPCGDQHCALRLSRRSLSVLAALVHPGAAGNGPVCWWAYSLRMDDSPCFCLLCAPTEWGGPVSEERDGRIAKNVVDYGWHVMGVAGDDAPGDWGYSIGLWHTLRSPEVSVFGLPSQTAMRVANAAGAAVRDGNPLEPDQRRGGRPQWLRRGRPARASQLVPRLLRRRHRFLPDPATAHHATVLAGQGWTVPLG